MNALLLLTFHPEHSKAAFHRDFSRLPLSRVKSILDYHCAHYAPCFDVENLPTHGPAQFGVAVEAASCERLVTQLLDEPCVLSVMEMVSGTA